PKQTLVVSGSPVDTCSSTSPLGAITVIAPVTSVATHTFPSPSTASESKSWNPGRPQRSEAPAGPNPIEAATSPGRTTSQLHTRRPRLRGIAPFAIRRQPDTVRTVERVDDLADHRAVRARIEEPRPVALPLAQLAVVGEPEAAVGIEHEIVRAAQRMAVALRV